ncbi:type II secretion system F family protein [Roseicyclus persicicus]|uniref:Pilus assembly protein TadB n=1 Tax=Roseicyclus persicicus TaxID=2650661 RepID=A0A7X6H0T2_9RHOB|nr:type II secretion system F family protein [Roseibacterium persicicum]NKX45936.1 pilus assembly protein TadB [Roseibacterium persicicum]
MLPDPQILILAGGVAGLCGLGGIALVLRDRGLQRHRLRLRRAGAEARPADRPLPGAARDRGLRRARRFGRQGPAARALAWLDQRIDRAGLQLSGAELTVQMSLAALGVYAAGTLAIGLSPAVALALALALPPAGLAAALAIATRRRLAAFTAALPDALDIFARSLKAGRPVADGLGIVVASARDPLRGELARCRDRIRMGATLTAAFDELAARMPTPEARFFGVAVALQAETGGNLVETTENLAAQLRDRRKLRQKARALSAEARASAAILAALPFAVGVVLWVLNPGYLEPLLTDPRGRAMLIIGLALIGLGILMMTKMGKLDV